MKIRLGLCAVLFGASTFAYGDLLQLDWQTSGDGFVTRADGFDFLDLSQTEGLSYNSILSQMGSGGTFEGWRFANTTELESLFLAAGAVVTEGNFQDDNIQQGPENIAAANALLGGWGEALSPYEYFFADPDIDSGSTYFNLGQIVTYSGGAAFSTSDAYGSCFDMFDACDSSKDFGLDESMFAGRGINFALIRDVITTYPATSVPEPGTLFTFVAGLALLRNARRRK